MNDTTSALVAALKAEAHDVDSDTSPDALRPIAGPVKYSTVGEGGHVHRWAVDADLARLSLYGEQQYGARLELEGPDGARLATWEPEQEWIGMTAALAIHALQAVTEALA